MVCFFCFCDPVGIKKKPNMAAVIVGAAVGATIGALGVAWFAALLFLWCVTLRRYDRLLAETGMSVAAAAVTTGGKGDDGDAAAAAGDVVAAAVRYNPVAYAASACDTAEAAGRSLAAAGWRLLHWHRPNPTFLLCVRGGEAVVAFRGTETAEDAAANRDVWGSAYAEGGIRVRIHRGVRRLLAGYLAGPLSDPSFRSALRSVGALDRLVVVGYSLGGSVAAGLAVLLRNPRLAPAFDLPAEAVAGLLADAGGLSRGADVHCVAYACPPVFRFHPESPVLPDLRNVATVVKEGDAVPCLSLANICGAVGLPFFPDAWTLRPVGALLVVSDEAWRGRSLDWLEANRAPRGAVRLYYAAPWDRRRATALLGRGALVRAAPAAFRGLALVRPLHSHERWRWTVDALAAEAAAAGLLLPHP